MDKHPSEQQYNSGVDLSRRDLELGALLQERGLLPDEMLAGLGDQPGGKVLLQLEIHDDVEPAPLGRAEMKVFGRALTGMRMGQMTQATELIELLVQKYPEFKSMAFNVAEAEKHSGDLALEEQAWQHLAFPKGLRRIHQQEYGTFLSVQGRLALVEGKPQEAGKLLELAGQVSGEESAAYQLLDQAVFQSADSPDVAASF